MAETGYLAAVRASYDAVAADYVRLVAAPDAMDPVSRSMLSAFAELAGAAGLGPVADLGCGPGRVTAHLAGLGLPTFGIDLSPKMIMMARQAHPELRYAVGSMTALGLGRDTLGGILAWYSTYHTPPEQLPALFAEFQQALEQLGWSYGRNVQIDIRWGSDPERVIAYTKELVRLSPDVIFAGPTNVVLPLQRETRSIPIVFIRVADPIGQGVVESLARPNGNVTGFSNPDFALVGKWLQILKDIAPATTRVGLMLSARNVASVHYYRSFESLAPSLAMTPIDTTPIREVVEIERVFPIVGTRAQQRLGDYGRRCSRSAVQSRIGRPIGRLAPVAGGSHGSSPRTARRGSPGVRGEPIRKPGEFARPWLR